MSTTPLTDTLSFRDREIVRDYMKDFSYAKAATRMGLSTPTVSKVIRSPGGQLSLEELIFQRGERTQIDSDWVLRELASLWQADIADITNPETGCMLPIHDWPVVWRRIVTSLDVGEMKYVTPGMGDTPDFLGNQVEDSVFIAGAVKKFKGVDKLRVLELIGKHAGVQAFIEKLAVATDSELTDALARGRTRLLEHQGKPESKELSFI